MKYGPWAVVTGASSGIGHAFSLALAAQGMNVVLIARREARLRALETTLVAQGVAVRVVVADLSQDDFMPAVIAATQDIAVGLLVNNAGFTVTGRYLDQPVEAALALLNVNCRAPMALAHHFGRLMSTQQRGGIINIASAAGLLPIPFWAAYAASKAHLLSFSEALWYELRRDKVDVLALCPGNTRTEFAGKSNTAPSGMAAEAVVHAALKQLGKRPSYVVGFGNYLSVLIGRLLSRKQTVLLGSKIIGE